MTLCYLTLPRVVHHSPVLIYWLLFGDPNDPEWFIVFHQQYPETDTHLEIHTDIDINTNTQIHIDTITKYQYLYQPFRTKYG